MINLFSVAVQKRQVKILAVGVKLSWRQWTLAGNVLKQNWTCVAAKLVSLASIGLFIGLQVLKLGPHEQLTNKQKASAYLSLARIGKCPKHRYMFFNRSIISGLSNSNDENGSKFEIRCPNCWFVANDCSVRTWRFFCSKFNANIDPQVLFAI